MLFSLPRASILAPLAIIVATLAADPWMARPSEIGPRKKVHETMTLMASDCVRTASREERPSVCSQSPAAVMDNKVLENAALDLNALGLGVVYAKELAEAVKWPDDPTGEIAGRTIAKFALKMSGKCEKHYSGGVNNGLLCSSHYGPLQFWHAMASSPEESTAETQRKMLAWAEFLYDVAAGEADLKRNYCDYWQAQRGQAGKGELAKALVPDGYFVCTKSGPPWTISTLFSMKCKNPFSSKDCTESLDPRAARVRALGALLHMVQDSYAQGHAGRGSCETTAETKQVTSKFECLPIKQFYTYSAQDKRKHAQADAPPQPGPSCAGASTIVDDPILASANALWFVQQKKGAAALTEYLTERVFPLSEDHELKAGAGDCFAKQITRSTPARGAVARRQQYRE